MAPLPAVIIKALAPAIAKKVAKKIAGKRGEELPTLVEEEIREIVDEATREPDIAKELAGKNLMESRTILAGLAIAALSAVGVGSAVITAGDIAEIGKHLTQIVTGVLGLVAVWGRIKARKSIA